MRYMLLLSPFYRWIKTTVKYSQKSVSIVTSVTSSIRTAITRGPADQKYLQRAKSLIGTKIIIYPGRSFSYIKFNNHT